MKPVSNIGTFYDNYPYFLCKLWIPFYEIHTGSKRFFPDTLDGRISKVETGQGDFMGNKAGIWLRDNNAFIFWRDPLFFLLCFMFIN